MRRAATRAVERSCPMHVHNQNKLVIMLALKAKSPPALKAKSLPVEWHALKLPVTAAAATDTQSSTARCNVYG